MNNKKIFIVGGGSYLGYELTLRLANKYAQSEIHYVARKNHDFLHKNINYINSDEFFNNDDQFDHAIVFYFISLDRSECESSSKLADINVGLFSKTLKKFKESKILYLSTFSVYRDSWDFDLITEESIPKFTHPYALSHYICEVLGRDLAPLSGNDFFVGRLTNSFGWIERCFAERYVLNNLMYGAVVNHEVVLQSDGNFVRDFIYINDVIRVLELFLKGKNHEIPKLFNICSEESYLVRDIAVLIRNIAEEELSKNISLIISGKNIDSREPIKLLSHRRSIVKSCINKNLINGFTSIEDGIRNSIKALSLLKL